MNIYFAYVIYENAWGFKIGCSDCIIEEPENL